MDFFKACNCLHYDIVFAKTEAQGFNKFSLAPL